MRRKTYEELERELDIMWGTVKFYVDSYSCHFTKRVGPMTADLAKAYGCGYTKAQLLLDMLVNEGSIVAKWNHQHQSYWSRHFWPNCECQPHTEEQYDQIPF